MKHYVYIVKADKWIKVGVSHNVSRRIKMMQTGCPLKIHLLGAFPFQSRAEAFSTESDVHKQLKPCRRFGEWFDYKKAKKLLKFEVNGKKILLTKGFEWRADVYR